MAKERQGFVGNIQCQFGLLGGAGLFLSFDALYQHHNKANTDAAEDHRDTDF
ncbi:hypothetical protein D3C81_1574220 [compost metagenome]